MTYLKQPKNTTEQLAVLTTPKGFSDGSGVDRWDERRQGLVKQQVAIAPGRAQQQKEVATLEGEAIAPEELTTAEKAIAPGKEASLIASLEDRSDGRKRCSKLCLRPSLEE